MMLYIAPDTPDEVIQELLGLPGWAALQDTPADAPLPLVHNEASQLNAAAHALVGLLQARGRRFMRWRVAVRGRSADETAFSAKLVEDRVGTSMSYIEFLCHVHRRICDALRKV